MHTTISTPLTHEQYETLNRRLRAGAKAGKEGIYSLAFNNCAHFSAQIGADHGIPIKRRLIMTPAMLARQIERIKNTPQ